MSDRVGVTSVCKGLSVVQFIKIQRESEFLLSIYCLKEIKLVTENATM